MSATGGDLRSPEMTHNVYGPVGTRRLITIDSLTVWEIRVDSGDQLAMHRHRHPYLVVHTCDGLIRVTELDGKSVVREVSTGMADWHPVGEIHELTNLGDRPYTNVLIELTTPASPAQSTTNAETMPTGERR